MSAGVRLTREDAYALAEEVSERLSPHVLELKVVGSVRRQRKTVGDIEFLARPVMNGDLFGGETPALEWLLAALATMGSITKAGERMMQVTDLFGRADLKLDLFLCWRPASWGSLLAIRTGPADLGRYVVTVMQRHGHRHVDGHAETLDGKRVSTDTEERFFALAGVPCVPPSQRDALIERLLREGINTEATR